MIENESDVEANATDKPTTRTEDESDVEEDMTSMPKPQPLEIESEVEANTTSTPQPTEDESEVEQSVTTTPKPKPQRKVEKKSVKPELVQTLPLNDEDRTELDEAPDNIYYDVIFGRNMPNFGKQLLCASSALFNAFGHGIIDGSFASYVRGRDLPPPIDGYLRPLPFEMFSSASYVTYPVGVVLCGLAMAKIGRKMAIILSPVPLLLCSLILHSAMEPMWIVIAFILMDVSAANIALANIVYISEITEADLRGFFAALLVVVFWAGAFVGAGSTFRVADEKYVGHYAIGISVVSSCLGILFGFAIPETPVWSLLNANRRQATETFFWLHGKTADTATKFENLINNVHQDRKRGLLAKIFAKSFIKPTFVLVLMYTVEASVSNELIVRHAISTARDEMRSYYRKPPLRPFPSGEDPVALYRYWIMPFVLYIEIMRIAAGIAVLLTIHKLKRKRLFVGSAFVTLVVTLCLYVGTYWTTYHRPTKFVLFSVYIVAVNAGVTVIPYTVTAEYFPQSKRVLGSGFALIYYRLAERYCKGPLYLETLHALVPGKDTVRFYKIAWLTSVVATLMLIFIMRETEGLTLHDAKNTVIRGSRQFKKTEDDEDTSEL